MRQKFKLKANAHLSQSMTFHPQTAERLGISGSNKLSLYFGVLSCPVEIISSKQVGLNQIIVSQNIIDALKIPLFCRYEIVMEGQSLFIGPFIAIMPEKKEERMKRRVRAERITNVSLFHFTEFYEEIGGAILAFSEEGVDPSRKTIQGYMFNPEKKIWEKDAYPYPASLFLKVRVAQDLEKHFHRKIGNKQIFNNPVFDKWEMHKLLDADPQLRAYLPHTILYQNPEDIHRLLERHRQVYIKPIAGENGIEVWKACKKKNKFIVQAFQKGRNQEYRFKTAAGTSAFFESKVRPGQFIIQQGLDLCSFNHRIIDFRFILIKDQTGDWREMGVYSRQGAPDSVISNLDAGAVPELGEVTLRKITNQSKANPKEIRRTMSTIGMSVSRVLNESTVRCGNIGLDLAVDKRNRLWIIEVNQVDPGHSIAKKVGKTDIYYQIRLANMLYAKKLAGFEK